MNNAVQNNATQNNVAEENAENNMENDLVGVENDAEQNDN